MSSSAPVPYFAAPPAEYNRNYIAQVTRAFSVFVQQVNNPGPITATALKLTDLPVYASNATALAGGLGVDEVYKTATGELRIVV